jgi:hypothetical protein
MSPMVEAGICKAPAYIEDGFGFEVADCWTLIRAPTQRSFLFYLL